MYEYQVKATAEITDEDGEVRGYQDFDLNVFANSEDEAMDKADDNIREQAAHFEDSSIDIISVKKTLKKFGY